MAQMEATLPAAQEEAPLEETEMDSSTVQPRCDQALAGFEPSAPPLDASGSQVGSLTAEANRQCIRLKYLIAGKTGSGKSATGNSLAGFGQQRRLPHFQEKRGFASTVMQDSIEVQFYEAKMGADIELKCTGIDTPGLMCTQQTPEDIYKHMAHYTLAAPDGLTAIVCVVKMCRMTDEELRTLEMLERFFGEDVWPHVVLVISHCTLRPEELAKELEQLPEGNKLRDVWEKCGKRAVAIDNKDTSNRFSVEGEEVMHQNLLASCEQIHTFMLDLEAKGQRYTNESFSKAAEVIKKVSQEMQGEWDLLSKERAELRTQLRQFQIPQEEFDSRMQALKEQEHKFMRKKRAMEVHRLESSLARSEFVKDVLVKMGMGMAVTTVGTMTMMSGLYAVGSAAGYAATALNTAGQAASYAMPPLIRLGGMVAAGVGLSRWWSVSVSFGGGR